MKWLVDFTTSNLALRRLDPDVAEQLQPQRLRPVADQHHLARRPPGLLRSRPAAPGSGRSSASNRAARRSPSPRRRPAGRKPGRSCRRTAAGTARRGRHRSTAAPRSGPRSGRAPRPGTSRSIRRRRIVVLSDGAPPPALSAGSAITTGLPLNASAASMPPPRQVVGRGAAAHGHELLRRSPSPADPPCALSPSVTRGCGRVSSGTSA